MEIMMKCGHSANAIKVLNGKEKPCCLICDCDEPAEKTPNLKGRKAKCSYCGRIQKSELTLPFFEYRPNQKFDSFYDGCGGWD